MNSSKAKKYKLCSMVGKPIKKFFAKVDINLRNYIYETVERIANKLANDRCYSGMELSLGEDNCKAKMVIGEKVGSGFNAVVYHINIKDASMNFCKKYPELFVNYNPRTDLIVKFPLDSYSLKNRQHRSILKEIKQAKVFAKPFRELHAAKVLFTSQNEKKPFIIKEYLNGANINQLAREQGGKLTEEQKEKLFCDIYEKATAFQKKYGFCVDIKPSNLVWDKDNKRWMMYEATARQIKSYYTQYGYNGYLAIFNHSMKSSLKKSRPSLKVACEAAGAMATGHIWYETARKNNYVFEPASRVVSPIIASSMRKGIGNPRALSPELDQQIKTLYSKAGYWHGSGRYQYASSRTHSTGNGENLIDVLDLICNAGQLNPRRDPLEMKDIREKSISLAPERMYARAYADTHTYNLKSQPRLGSSFFWSEAYLGDIGLEMLKDYAKLDKNQSNNIYNNFCSEEGLTGWKSKVTKDGFSDPLPSPEDFKRWSNLTKSRKLIRPYLSLVDTFRTGSDIPSNYPILFGINKNSVHRTTDASKAIAIHEVRCIDPLKIADAITHLEVPRLKVAETANLLKSKGLGHIPVLAIEDCESFLSKYPIRDVYAQKINKPKSHKRPYIVTGPCIQNLNTKDFEQLKSAEKMIPDFKWNGNLRYYAGLIPVRRDKKGELEVLLLKRSNLVRKGGVWATPGGSCNHFKDRHPLISAIRETREEIGCTPSGIVNTKPIILESQDSKNIYHGYLWFVNEKNFRPQLNWENTKFKWVSLSQLELESPGLMTKCAAVLRHISEPTQTLKKEPASSDLTLLKSLASKEVPSKSVSYSYANIGTL